MERKFIVVGVMLVLFACLMGFTEVDLVESSSNLFIRQRESFSNIRSIFSKTNETLIRGNLLEEVIVQEANWEDNDVWDMEDKYNYFYDENGKLEYVKMFYWDRRTEDWIGPAYRSYIEYLDNGLIDKVSQQIFSPYDSLWVDFIIITQQYNDNEQIEVVIMELYNWAEQEYVEQLFINMLYDEEDMVETIYMSWLDDEEDDRVRSYSVEKVELYYDEFGRVIETIESSEIDEDEWELVWMSMIDYHESDEGDYSDVQAYLNNYALLMALPTYEGRKSFGNIEVETMFEWEEEGNWYLVEREVYFYDDNDKVERLEYQEWYEDGEELIWEAFGRILFNYNEDDQLAEMIKQWKDEVDDMWMNDERMLYKYEGMTSIDGDVVIPEVLMATNFPNPFNPETTIAFNLISGQEIELNIYNIKGQVVNTLAKGYFDAGQHRVVWNGHNNIGKPLSSGVYFYRLWTNDGSVSGKMMMIK